MTSIEILSSGLLTTVQDAGRPGLAHIGVPPSGAADPVALERGNRLVGNPPGAAALEATLEGPVLRFDGPATVAVTGAWDLPPRRVAAGDVLELGRFVEGVRAYVCVRGGIDVEPTLGSRSTDLLTGLGPAPLRAGDRVPVGPEPAGEPEAVVLGQRAFRARRCSCTATSPVLRIVPGPRDDWFAAGALAALCSDEWQVSASSNRVGIRLEGTPLERARPGELLSEGVVTGALQVPPNGQPILLMQDHPTTGGYPVIAVVCTADLWLAGQLAPGNRVRFALRG